MGTRYVLTDPDDKEQMQYGVVANRMFSNVKRGSRVVSFLDGDIVVIVKMNDDVRTVIVIKNTFDLQFYPVGTNVLENKYVDGVSISVVSEDTDPETIPEGLVVGDHPPGSAFINAVLDKNQNKMTLAFGKKSAGSFAWSGDSPNVISYKGFLNDFREKLETQTGSIFYTNHNYEWDYFDSAHNRKAPESIDNHLGQDTWFTDGLIPPDPYNTPEGASNHVFRNGRLAKKAPLPVIAACEFENPSKPETYLLRVMCGSFSDQVDSGNYVLNNENLYFEAHTVSTFYVFDEDPDPESITGWTLVRTFTLTSPGTNQYTNNPLSPTAIVHQMPVFNANGTTALAILSPAFRDYAQPNERFYFGTGSTQVNIAVSYVVTFDMATGLVSYTTPASKYRYQRDFADASTSLWEQSKWEQIVGVCANGETVKRIDTTTTTKDVSDGSATWTSPPSITVGGGAGGASFAQAFFEGIGSTIVNRMKAAEDAMAVYLRSIGYTDYVANYNFSVPCYYDGISSYYQQYDQTYEYRPYVSSGGATTHTGVVVNVGTGAVTCGDWQLLSNQIDYYLWSYYYSKNIATDEGGNSVYLSNPLSKSQLKEIEEKVEFDSFGTVISQSRKDTYRRYGVKPNYRGNGFVLAGYKDFLSNQGFTNKGYWNVWIHVNRCFGLDLTSTSSETHEPVLDDFRCIAFDPVKNASIIKNMANESLSFFGAPSIDF